MRSPAIHATPRTGTLVSVQLDGGVGGDQITRGMARQVVALAAAAAADAPPIIPQLTPDQLPREFQIFQPGPNPTADPGGPASRRAAGGVTAKAERRHIAIAREHGSGGAVRGRQKSTQS